jgi:hypothetical protein
MSPSGAHTQPWGILATPQETAARPLDKRSPTGADRIEGLPRDPPRVLGSNLT